MVEATLANVQDLAHVSLARHLRQHLSCCLFEKKVRAITGDFALEILTMFEIRVVEASDIRLKDVGCGFCPVLQNFCSVHVCYETFWHLIAPRQL